MNKNTRKKKKEEEEEEEEEAVRGTRHLSLSGAESTLL